MHSDKRGTGEAAHLSLLSRDSLWVTAVLAVCIAAGQAVALLESLIGKEQVFEHRPEGESKVERLTGSLAVTCFAPHHHEVNAEAA